VLGNNLSNHGLYHHSYCSTCPNATIAKSSKAGGPATNLLKNDRIGHKAQKENRIDDPDIQVPKYAFGENKLVSVRSK
jgi:hypothetical protein